MPGSILIFGAADHIGSRLAKFLTKESPVTRLRLATHSEDKAVVLQRSLPAAEVVLADFAVPSSLEKAVEGMEGVFVTTPRHADEKLYMDNLVAALKKAGTVIQIVRIMGIHPDESMKQIPLALRESGRGPHPVARAVLDASGLPVTYLNCGATFMDNFTRLGPWEAVRRDRKLIWPEHLVPWIDSREITEVAGRLFLSNNHRHIGQFHTMNDGQDLLRYAQMADMPGDVLGHPVGYDDSKDAFLEAYAGLGSVKDYIWSYMQYEQDNEGIWALNDFVERTLGRKPRSPREWLVEHESALLDNDSKVPA